MSPALAVALALLAVPKIAAPGLAGVGIEKERAEFFTEHFAGALRNAGLGVVTHREISSLLGLERQRQLLGCSADASSCMAELANALGADGVALGDIARLEGGAFQVTLKIIAAADGTPLASRTGRVRGEEALTDALTRAAYEMAREVLGRLRPREPLPESVTRDLSKRPFRVISLVPAGVGVVGGVLGVVMLGQAASAHTRLISEPSLRLTEDEANSIASAGKLSQTLGYTLLSVGLAAIATAAVMFVWKEEPVSLQAWLSGAQPGFAGVWP